MRTRLIFVRHAEAEGNVARVFHGWYNSKLTQKGEEQAKLVAKRLKDIKIDALYSSTLERTYKTASYIAWQIGLPIITSPNLREINGGDWENEKWVDIPKKWPIEHEHWQNSPNLLKLPNGETMLELQQRMLTEVYKIINENEGKTICIVTHGTAIKALKCKFLGIKLKDMKAVSWCENTAVTMVDYDQETDTFDVIMDGDASHLTEDMQTIIHQDWWKELHNTLGDVQNRIGENVVKGE